MYPIDCTDAARPTPSTSRKYEPGVAANAIAASYVSGGLADASKIVPSAVARKIRNPTSRFPCPLASDPVAYGETSTVTVPLALMSKTYMSASALVSMYPM